MRLWNHSLQSIVWGPVLLQHLKLRHSNTPLRKLIRNCTVQLIPNYLVQDKCHWPGNTYKASTKIIVDKEKYLLCKYLIKYSHHKFNWFIWYTYKTTVKLYVQMIVEVGRNCYSNWWIMWQRLLSHKVISFLHVKLGKLHWIKIDILDSHFV